MSKRIIYKYIDDRRSDDMEIDLTDELSFRRGDFVMRGGKDWKIESVFCDMRFTDEPNALKTLWLYLVQPPVN